MKRWFGRRETARADEDISMPETEDTRPCPHCRRPVSRGATVCLYCERDLTPVMAPDRFIQLFGTVDHTKPAEDD